MIFYEFYTASRKNCDLVLIMSVNLKVGSQCAFKHVNASTPCLKKRPTFGLL